MTDFLETTDAPVSGPSPWKVGIKYGIIAGLLAIALQLIGYLSGMGDMEKQMSGQGMLWGAVSWLVTVAITVVMAIMAIREYRRQSLNGMVSFGNAFSASFAVVIFKALLLAVFVFVFYSFVISDQLEEMRAMMEEAMEESGADSERFGSFFSGVMTSPSFAAISTFFTTLVGGSILGLIVSLIMKND